MVYGKRTQKPLKLGQQISAEGLQYESKKYQEQGFKAPRNPTGVRVYSLRKIAGGAGAQKMMIWLIVLEWLLTVAPSYYGSQHFSGPVMGGSAATRVAPGDTPLNLVETLDGFLISTNSGFGAHYLQAFDERGNKVTDRIEFRSLWYGLAYAPMQKSVLASTGAHSVIVTRVYAGKFGKPREISFDHCELTAGVAVLDESTAVVACNRSYEAIRFNFLTGKILKRVKVGEFPFAVKTLPDGRVAVANWGQASVSILDGTSLRTLRTISVGSHPADELVIPDKRLLLVACSDSDLVSVIDLDNLREVRQLKIQELDSKLSGGQPDALAFDRVTGKLYVALAGINALAALNQIGTEKESSLEGLIPVGSYPTALLYSRRVRGLFIADGRNLVSGPSSPHKRQPDADKRSGIPAGPRGRHTPAILPEQTHKTDSGARTDYIGYLLGGGIEVLRDEEIRAARRRTIEQRVYGDVPRSLSEPSRDLIRYFSAKTNPHAPIHHVIYIIKENRTYDQLLGDIKEGNGDPDLALFGEPVTPNQHALARQFILFDNFYVDGDVSADGHVWSTAASSTDYVNKLWPSFYSQHLKYEFEGADYDGDVLHEHPIAIPASGPIWEAAQRAGMTYRDYGEWCVDEGAPPGETRCHLKGLKDHYDPLYLDGIGTVTDRKRVEEWEREFHEYEQNGNLPQLTIIHLPNDHTLGTWPGRPTPRALIADNDIAFGRLVEVVSHSRFWPETAIFVLEDDAQDGPDHVDAHRSLLFVVSPYTRRAIVEHSFFSTTSVLRTIEQILGLTSLTYFDDRASSLLMVFQKQPVLGGYRCLHPGVPLDEVNSPDAPGAKESAHWDFSRPDRVPEQELNRAIWKSVKGKASEPPAPIVTVRWKQLP
jgi:DNA-binding beta-propeller fold protein YncE